MINILGGAQHRGAVATDGVGGEALACLLPEKLLIIETLDNRLIIKFLI